MDRRWFVNSARNVWPLRDNVVLPEPVTSFTATIHSDVIQRTEGEHYMNRCES